MKSWPKSAVRLLALFAAGWFVSLAYVWNASNDNYRQVGLNNGSIEERHKLIQKLRTIVPLEQCTDWTDKTRVVELVSVKAEQVDARVAPDGSIRLCEH